MASNYRVMVHFHFKEGKEEEGIKFLENELIKKGKEFGCHYVELWQNEKDPTIVEGVAVWNDLEDARNFQSKWKNKEQELISKFCTGDATREFCIIRSIYMEKPAKKAA